MDIIPLSTHSNHDFITKDHIKNKLPKLCVFNALCIFYVTQYVECIFVNYFVNNARESIFYIILGVTTAFFTSKFILFLAPKRFILAATIENMIYHNPKIRLIMGGRLYLECQRIP